MIPKNFILFLFILMLFSSCNSKSRIQKLIKGASTDFPESYIGKLDTTLMENSGIIYWNKMLWTFNDSGGKNELYGFNRKTGEIKVTIQVENSTNVDWEDIAQDEHSIYIADTGNNLGKRTDLKVLKLPKDKVTKASFQKITAEKIKYKYADQSNFNNDYKKHSFDCEGLIVFKDTLFLFTKDWVNYKTKVYAMPSISGEYSLNAIDSFNVVGLITGADISEKGKIALIGYQNYKSFAWTFEKSDDQFFGKPKRIDLGMLENAQTEGICFDKKGHLLISCEYTESYNQQVWRLEPKYFKEK